MDLCIQNLRKGFTQGTLRPVAKRIETLKHFESLIKNNEKVITSVLYEDLRKPYFESYTNEIGLMYAEIQHTVKNLHTWAKAKRVSTPIAHFPGSSHIKPEPLGVIFVIGAYNYPIQLSLCPAFAAISAGNSVLLKPSELAPHTSRFLCELINNNFDPEIVRVVEGGKDEVTAILNHKFDHIFFTGSARVGKIILQKAAETLTPVTLELGGKSPCIVHHDAPLDVTAKRIVWGKFLNLGQTCVAPDYVIAHKDIEEPLAHEMKKAVKQFFGEHPNHSKDLARIVSKDYLKRLIMLLDKEQPFIGGEHDIEDRYLAPTIVRNVGPNSKLMQEEIFGPILPMMRYAAIEDAIEIARNYPTPLALYLFMKDKDLCERVIQEVQSGGVSVNDTMCHAAITSLPFGGVGMSGMGRYRGKFGFDTFSHMRSVFWRSLGIDIPLRYPPYKKFNIDLAKWII